MTNQYSPLRVLFYPLVLVMLFGGIYFIYEKNPALMDQLSLIEKQKTTGKEDEFLMSASEVDPAQRPPWTASSITDRDHGRTGAYSDNEKIRYRFHPSEAKISFPNDKSAAWTIDDQGVVAHTGDELRVYDKTGALKWSLEPGEKTFCSGAPTVAAEVLFLCFQQGDVAAFYRETGKLAWLFHTGEKLNQMPALGPKGLLLPRNLDDKTWALQIIDPNSGKLVKEIEKLLGPVAGRPAFSKDGQLMSYATTNGHLYVRNLDSKNSLWKNEFPTGFGASPTIYGDRLYVISEDGVVFCYELKSGKEIWEYTLNQPTHSSLTIFPGLQQGAVLDDKGYLHLMDLKEGKRKWRFSTSSNAKTQRFMAIRLTNESLTKLSLTNEGKGWTLWGPCKDNQVCAIDPVKGILFRRLELSGPMLAPVFFVNDGNELWTVAQVGKNVELVKFIEDTYQKQLQQKPQEAVDNGGQEN